MRWGTAMAGLGITPTPTMISASIICDGRRLVGTVAQDPATGMWLARCTLLHAGFHSCGQHESKAAAALAILRVSGESSAWDM
jgi:hypothetical protein